MQQDPHTHIAPVMQARSTPPAPAVQAPSAQVPTVEAPSARGPSASGAASSRAGARPLQSLSGLPPIPRVVSRDSARPATRAPASASRGMGSPGDTPSSPGGFGDSRPDPQAQSAPPGSSVQHAVVARNRQRLASEALPDDSNQRQRRRNIAPELTVGTPATNRTELPSGFRLWARRRIGLVFWDGDVDRLLSRRPEVALAARHMQQLGVDSARADEARVSFLLRLIGQFQTPAFIIGDRVTVNNANEALFVNDVGIWLMDPDPSASVDMANNAWAVPDIDDYSLPPGSDEPDAYRRLRFFLYFMRGLGRYVTLNDLEMYEDSSRSTLQLIATTDQAEVYRAVGLRASDYAEVPEAIALCYPAPGGALGVNRVLQHFGIVAMDPERWGVPASQCELFRSRFQRMAYLEHARLLAIAVFADHYHTGRVVCQSGAFIRSLEIYASRILPSITVTSLDAEIDLQYFIELLKEVNQLADGYMYERRDTLSGEIVRWAYHIDGEWQEAGPRAGVYGGWPADPERNPEHPVRYVAVPGEPGHVALPPVTLRQTLHVQELLYHFPNLRGPLGRLIGMGRRVAVRNVLERLSAYLNPSAQQNTPRASRNRGRRDSFGSRHDYADRRRQGRDNRPSGRTGYQDLLSDLRNANEQGNAPAQHGRGGGPSDYGQPVVQTPATPIRPGPQALPLPPNAYQGGHVRGTITDRRRPNPPQSRGNNMISDMPDPFPEWR